MTNELYHHGVKGQRWGTQNGPPYPLYRQERFSTKADYNRVMAKKAKGSIKGSTEGASGRRSDAKSVVSAKRLNSRRKKENKLVRKVTVAEYNRDSMHEQSKKATSRAERREMEKLSKVYDKDAQKNQRKLDKSRAKTEEIIKKLRDEGYDVDSKEPNKVTEAARKVLDKVFKSPTSTRLYDYAKQDVEKRINRNKYEVTKQDTTSKSGTEKSGTTKEGRITDKLKEIVDKRQEKKVETDAAKREKDINSGNIDVRELSDKELDAAVNRIRKQNDYLRLVGKETPEEAKQRIKQEQSNSLTKAIVEDLKKTVVVPAVSGAAAYTVKRLVSSHTNLDQEAIDEIFKRVGNGGGGGQQQKKKKK